MFKLLRKLLTKNTSEIPLLWLNVNLKALEAGEDKFFNFHGHPQLEHDEILHSKMKEIVDHLKKTCDFSDL